MCLNVPFVTQFGYYEQYILKKPLEPAIIETVNEAMQAYEYAPLKWMEMNGPTQVLQVIKGLASGNPPNTNSIPQE